MSLKKIWGCEDGRVGSKKDDLKNLNPTFASIFFDSLNWNVTPENQDSKGAQKSKLLAEHSLPGSQGLPSSPCGKSCRHSRRAAWTDRGWRRWEGYLGPVQNFLVLACLDETGEARPQLDLKLVRDTRSNQISFSGNISSKRKTEEQVVGRGWWISILVDNLHWTRVWAMLFNLLLLELGRCWCPPEVCSNQHDSVILRNTSFACSFLPSE